MNPPLGINKHPGVVEFLSTIPGSLDGDGMITTSGWMHLVVYCHVSLESRKSDTVTDADGRTISATFSWRASRGEVYGDGECTCTAASGKVNLAAYADTCAKIRACKALFLQILWSRGPMKG
jgi:hypothetical protein